MISLSNVENVFDARPVEILPLEFESLDQPVFGMEHDTAARLVELEERIRALEAEMREEREAAKMTLDQTRQEAVESTRAKMTTSLQHEVTMVREGVARAINGFIAERTRYFAEIEGETVSLALAIAERILHREAVMDPMLLRGAVRVALEKVAGESMVRLRVPEEQAQAWSDVIASGSHHESVTVVEDRHLTTREAVIETAIGRIEIGVAAQLKEIERGFFDLLAKRPQ